MPNYSGSQKPPLSAKKIHSNVMDESPHRFDNQHDFLGELKQRFQHGLVNALAAHLDEHEIGGHI